MMKSNKHVDRPMRIEYRHADIYIHTSAPSYDTWWVVDFISEDKYM